MTNKSSQTVEIPASAREDHSSAATRTPLFQVYGFVIFTILYIYLILFVFPHTPIYRDGDGELFFATARRLFSGEVMYRDFNQFVFPGTEVLFVLLFQLFGPAAWTPNVLLWGVGFGLAMVTWIISRQVIRGWAAFVPPLLFLTTVFPCLLDPTHHWFSVLAAMAAVAVLMPVASYRRLACAGALCGLSSWFTHSRGLMVMIGIACFLGWLRQQPDTPPRWLGKRLLCLWGSYLSSVVLLNAYFMWRAGIGQFLRSTIVFGVRYYSRQPDNSWGVYLAEFPHLSPWPGLNWLLINIFVHFLVPFFYLTFQWYFWKRRSRSRAQPWSQLMLLQAVGLCLYIGVAPGAELQRLATAAVPATILLVWMLTDWGKRGRGVLIALTAMALGYAVTFPARMQQRSWTYLQLPTGRVALSDVEYLDVYQWALSHLHPGDYFFANMRLHNFVYLAGVRSPAPVLLLPPTDYTRPAQVQQVIAGLEKHQVRYVLWDAQVDVPLPETLGFDHLDPLRAYLRSHYRVVKAFSNLMLVWERDGQGS